MPVGWGTEAALGGSAGPGQSTNPGPGGGCPRGLGRASGARGQPWWGLTKSGPSGHRRAVGLCPVSPGVASSLGLQLCFNPA